MKINFETMEVIVTDRDQIIKVIVPFKSVHAVQTTHGVVEEMMNGWEKLNRQQLRRAKRQMAGMNASLKWGDEYLNEKQTQFGYVETANDDDQLEFNTDALIHTLWEHFVNGTRPAIIVGDEEIAA